MFVDFSVWGFRSTPIVTSSAPEMASNDLGCPVISFLTYESGRRDWLILTVFRPDVSLMANSKSHASTTQYLPKIEHTRQDCFQLW